MEVVIHRKAGIHMKKAILLLMSVQFFVYLGFGIIIPILPEVIVQQGFSEVHVGGLTDDLCTCLLFHRTTLGFIVRSDWTKKTYFDWAYRI